MPLWAKIDVEMPTDAKLLGQPVATRLLWLCLICLAKQQDSHGEIRGFDCALLAGRFNIPRKSVADAITHFQATRMAELDADGAIRLLNFDKRQGDVTVEEQRANWRDRQARHRGVSRVTEGDSHAAPSPVSHASRVEEEVEKEEDPEKSSRSKSLEAKASQGVAVATAAAPVETQAPTSAVWDSYSAAYENRYGEKPTRNKKVNGQLAHFITRIPRDEAPDVAAFYVSHSGQLYVRAMHCVDLLLRDAEGLRTQWATGRQVTGTSARQQDRTAANLEAIRPLLRGDGS